MALFIRQLQQNKFKQVRRNQIMRIIDGFFKEYSLDIHAMESELSIG